MTLIPFGGSIDGVEMYVMSTPLQGAHRNERDHDHLATIQTTEGKSGSPRTRLFLLARFRDGF
jgi:hypothetical protein